MDRSPEQLLELAGAEYAAGHLDEAFDAMEKAYDAATASGNKVLAAAAATRTAMHVIIDWGLLAPVRVWLKRAERALDDLPTTRVHPWFFLAKAYERLFSGDFEQGRRFAQQAIETGTEQGEVSAAAMARVTNARSHIFLGDLDVGLGLLEEAAIGLMTDDVDDLTRGMTLCEIVCAWQGVAMYDLSEEWTQASERFTTNHNVGSAHGRCRIHRAEILRLRGDLDAAEREALAACDELRPYLRREYGWPLTELGTIRLRKGDLEGAEEAFLEAHEKGWEPHPGLALLRLAQGDVRAALALINETIESPVGHLSKELPPNNDLRQAPLLEAQVEIAIAADDIPAAATAADDLCRIADSYKSKALAAAASLARGRVMLATDDMAEAARAFRNAVHIWSEIGAPYELAHARMGLGHAHRAQGFEEGAVLEFSAARRAFAGLGADVFAEAAGAAIDAGTPPAPSPRSHSAFEFFPDGDHWIVTFDSETTLLRDLKGLRYLGRLLAEPGREFHASDLVATDRGASLQTPSFDREEITVSVGEDAGAMLDDLAKEQYRRRLADIDEDIEEANRFGDAMRRSRAESEREFLVSELARAVGMGGRDRRAGSTSERARAAATRAIRNAMKKIGEHHPALYEHLDRTVRTGTYCAYEPDPKAAIDWRLS